LGRPLRGVPVVKLRAFGFWCDFCVYLQITTAL
jgi:hypothetical protein